MSYELLMHNVIPFCIGVYIGNKLLDAKFVDAIFGGCVLLVTTALVGKGVI